MRHVARRHRSSHILGTGGAARAAFFLTSAYGRPTVSDNLTPTYAVGLAVTVEHMTLGLVVTVEKSSHATPTKEALGHILQDELARYEWKYLNVHGPLSEIAYITHAEASQRDVAAIIVAAHGEECRLCLLALARLQSEYPDTAALVEGCLLDSPPASEAFFHAEGGETGHILSHLAFPRKRIVILRGGHCHASTTRGASVSGAETLMLDDLHSVARVFLSPPPVKTATFVSTMVGPLQCQVASYDGRCTLIYAPKARCNVLADINAASNVGSAKFAAREMLLTSVSDRAGASRPGLPSPFSPIVQPVTSNVRRQVAVMMVLLLLASVVTVAYARSRSQ